MKSSDDLNLTTWNTSIYLSSSSSSLYTKLRLSALISYWVSNIFSRNYSRSFFSKSGIFYGSVLDLDKLAPKFIRPIFLVFYFWKAGATVDPGIPLSPGILKDLPMFPRRLLGCSGGIHSSRYFCVKTF